MVLSKYQKTQLELEKKRMRLMDTNTIKSKLILKAIEKHGKISPCGGEKLLDCFRLHDTGWTLYYNAGKYTYAVAESEVDNVISK